MYSRYHAGRRVDFPDMRRQHTLLVPVPDLSTSDQLYSRARPAVVPAVGNRRPGTGQHLQLISVLLLHFSPRHWHTSIVSHSPLPPHLVLPLNFPSHLLFCLQLIFTLACRLWSVKLPPCKSADQSLFLAAPTPMVPAHL